MKVIGKDINFDGEKADSYSEYSLFSNFKY